MNPWEAFGVGFVVGSWVGALVVALCVAARQSREMDEMEQRYLKEIEGAGRP